MSNYPPGVTTATIRVGTFVDFFGDAATVTAKVVPVLGNDVSHIVHGPTGTVMVPASRRFDSDAVTGVAEFDLPHTDAPGWLDPSGRAVTLWKYVVTVTATLNNGYGAGVSWSKDVQPLVGQTVIDLDLVPSGESSEPVTANPAAVLSVNGQTGHVSIEDLGGALTLEIGTVTTGAAGSAAAAAIRDTANGPVLDLTIPRGNTGATGTAAAITGATATGLPAGSAPTVTLGGSSTARTFAFGIPAGATGSGAAGGASAGGLAHFERLAPVAPRAVTSGAEYSHSTAASGQLGRTSRQWLISTANVSTIRLLYQNASTVRNLVTVPITVTAAVERSSPIVGTSAAVNVRVTFNGANSVSIPVGGYALSDPVVMDVKAGAGFFVRTFTGVAAVGNVWPNNTYTNNSRFAGEMSWYGDSTGSTATDGFAGSTVAHGPAAVLAMPTNKPVIGIIGDSISQGSGDEGSGDGYWARWGITNNLLVHRNAVNGELGRYILDTANGRDLIWLSMAGVDRAICALGTNDVAQWQSLSGIQTHFPKIWDRLAATARGGVWQTTILPYTQSSDGWATVGNQTLRTFESVRTGLNDWLRAGAPITGRGTAGTAGHPLAGVLDVAPAVEDAATGKWVGGMTADGVHPSPAGHAALAARLAAIAPAALIS